ncbi:MAG: hypothetical protein H6662_03435 [Ardenticatenaceae bacterium]|nr:hypothetical protein [Anaerolineales bacterium]MCB8920614.1 hypothetical protein [Ardenticatenaceae bacterium]MCB8990238.1 hypothetical protein [Ardenticatenaceae bacterium]MCB9002970.1 hypothetical protein [Ardenticatenaceae bacterium]
MKRILSFLSFTALFLVMGFMAFSSMPGRSDAAETNPDILVENPDIQPAAPMLQTSIYKYNTVAIPLDISDSITTAADLVDYFNSAPEGDPKTIDQVLHWDAAAQNFTDYYLPNLGAGDPNMPIELGEAYWIYVDNTANTSLTLVGSVPSEGTIQYDLLGSSPACRYNDVMIPLEESSILTASDLVTAMGGPSYVDQILEWGADAQNFTNYYLPNLGAGDPDMPIQAGHSYFVCLLQDTQWP